MKKHSHVRDLMVDHVFTVRPDQSLRSAVRLMHDHHFRQIPVVAEGHLVGILTDRDIRLHVAYLEDRLESADSWNDALDAPVEGVMTRDPQCLHADQTIEDALGLFVSEKYGGFPVVEGDGRLIGILTYIDLLAAYRKLLQAG
jgi:acetoin utilization protein AcuB